MNHTDLTFQPTDKSLIHLDNLFTFTDTLNIFGKMELGAIPHVNGNVHLREQGLGTGQSGIISWKCGSFIFGRSIIITGHQWYLVAPGGSARLSLYFRSQGDIVLLSSISKPIPSPRLQKPARRRSLIAPTGFELFA